MSLPNMLTIDVEDWFHGMIPAPADWCTMEDRLEIGLNVIRDLLSETNNHATFFVLASVAKKHAHLIRQLVADGHEIGSHGMWHRPLYTLTPAQFKEELKQSIDILQQITGHPIVGFRAPFFSITKQSQWALSILAEMGLRYDSSIFPVHNPRYGISNTPAEPYEHRSGIMEFPISVLPIGKFNMPFSGGFYGRLLPHIIIARCINILNQRKRSALIYFHPWEFDPGQPKVKFDGIGRLYHFTHYHNLRCTQSKLQKLLHQFKFCPLRDFLPH